MPSLLDLHDHELRIENIWPLPNGDVPPTLIMCAEVMNSLPDALQELLGPKELASGLYEGLFNGGGDEACQFAWEELIGFFGRTGKTGFLAEVHRPAMTYKADGKSCSYSWGMCRCEWFFGLTVESIVEQAIAWAKATDEAGFAKAREAQA